MSAASRAGRKRAKARKARIESRRQSQLSSKWRILLGLKTAWRGVSLAWKVFGGAMLLMGAVSQVYFFVWRLSVTPGETLKDSNPFATMFILQNEGQFPLYDLEFSCLANRVEDSRGNRIMSTVGHVDAYNVPVLGGNSKTSTPCYLGFGFAPSGVNMADISLTVSYHPSFYPFRRKKNFRYVAVRKDDGTYAWNPMADSAPP